MNFLKNNKMMYVLYVYQILKINKMILYKWIIVHTFFINLVFNNGSIHLIYVLYVKPYKMYNDILSFFFF